MDDLDKVLDKAEDMAMAEDMANKACEEFGMTEVGTGNLAVKQTIKTKEKHKRSIKYTFTEAEKREISDRLAQAVLEKDTAINELKSIQGQFNARKKTAEATISYCAQNLQSGYEYRSIDCETVKNYSAGTVITTRLDTLETVENRKMTIADRQMVIQEG